MDGQEARARLEADRERLLAARRALQGEGLDEESEEESWSELSAIDQHLADIATDVFEREKDLSLVARVVDALGEVEQALGRVDHGTYGRCQACGAPISDERLEAVPATRFCDEHERLWEGKELRFLPDGIYRGRGAVFADDRVEREAVQHFEFLPTDDELVDETVLGAEEAAMHEDRAPRRGPRLGSDELEAAEEYEAEAEADERATAEEAEAAERREAEAAEQEDEQLGPS